MGTAIREGFGIPLAIFLGKPGCQVKNDVSYSFILTISHDAVQIMQSKYFPAENQELSQLGRFINIYAASWFDINHNG